MCPVDQQGPQIAVIALADAEHHPAAAAGAVSWHQAKVGRHLTPAPEISRVADRGDYGGGGQRTYPR